MLTLTQGAGRSSRWEKCASDFETAQWMERGVHGESGYRVSGVLVAVIIKAQEQPIEALNGETRDEWEVCQRQRGS